MFYFYKMNRTSNIEIDFIGNTTKDWLLDDFIKYYEQNKEELDKIHSRRINSRVRIFDKQGNRYKVIRRHGKTIFRRISITDTTWKRDIITQIQELRALVAETKNLVDKKESEEAHTDDDGKFEENDLLDSIQNKKPIKKYPI